MLGFRDTNGEYVVHDEHKFNYGVGPSKGEALAAYKHILADDFLILSKQKAILAPSLRCEFDYLAKFVRRY